MDSGENEIWVVNHLQEKKTNGRMAVYQYIAQVFLNQYLKESSGS